MKLRPLYDRVVIKRMEEEQTSPGGLLSRRARRKSRAAGK